ncbi:biotin synthase [Roseateles sp. BYS87W]|uniref:Biotin synthase n=1 Tax=Pelomonas baiyunensis TaxID=3299026 RepID=A0ABW7GUQ3_9BURK
MNPQATPPNSKSAFRAQDLDEPAVNRQVRRLAAASAAPWLHAEVASRMAERLAYIKLAPKRVLDTTPALGSSLQVLREAYPTAEMLWHEAHPALEARAAAELAGPWWRKWWGSAARHVERLPAVPPVDLVWSNMALHAHADLPGLLSQWQGSLAVGGFVMFSCLGPDTFIELRALWSRLGWGLPAPMWWDMHDIGDLALKAGFTDPVMDQQRLRLTWGSPEQLLADLRALGGNLSPQRRSGLLGRRWHRQLLGELESLRDSDGRLALTLELVFGHAVKAAPRMVVAAETHVSLDSMRAALKVKPPGG